MSKLTIPAVPNFPLAPNAYDRAYGDQLNNVHRLYLNRLNSVVSAVVGNEGGQYLSFPYGSFYDTTTQTAAATDTAYAAKFNTTDTGNSVVVRNDGSSNPTQIVVDETGVYNFLFSLQLYNSGGSAGKAYIWIRINGTDVPYSMGQITVGAGAYGLQSWNFFPNLNGDDYVQLMWAADTTNIKLQTVSAPAFAPASPSAAMTVNFVSVPPTNSSLS